MFGSFFITIVLCLCLGHRSLVGGSSLALYNDTDCANVIHNQAALDGYPDGQCTHIPDLEDGDVYNSLMFLTLDDGCAITLYGPDSVVCSGPVFAASLNVCYNTSWTYYSVDGCTAPSISSSSASSTATSTSSASESSAAASSSTSSSSGGGASLSGGALAGVIIVAIVAAAAVAVAFIYYFGRKARRGDSERKRQEIEMASKPGSGAGLPGGGPPREYGSLGRTPLVKRADAPPVHEINGQGFVEASYENRFPLSNSAELLGHPPPNELPEKPYQH